MLGLIKLIFALILDLFRSRAALEAEILVLRQQFTMDARGAPYLLAHPSDEFAQLRFDFGPARLTVRFPAPIGPKPCSMPPQDRVRLNDAGQTEQAWPDPGNPHHQGAITAM
jgi:hypothetical protein